MTEKFPDIDADLARVSFRRPILDDGSLGDGPYTMLSETTMEDVRDQRRWGIITEAVRRAVISDSEARELVKQGVGLITGEQVPTEFIGRMQGVAQVNRAAQIAGRGFLGRLALPSVPETAIGKDIRHTPHLDSDQHGIAKGLLELALAHYFEHGRYEKVLQRIQKNAEGPGTTMAEKRLLAQRYRFARDVKLLGLLAEMVNEIPEYHANGEDMEARLKSGTQIVLTRDAYTDDPLLRDPLQWLGRKQLKDRVYRARIGEKDYILKERKTDRHTDTKEKGHQPGNTSRQEFEVAKQMSKLPTSSIGGITVTWEKPLGYVEFPDGYQFCLFEDAGSIIPGDVDSQRTAVTKLGQAIIAHEEAYTAEFKQVQAAAAALLQERLDLFNPHNTADKVAGQSKHAGLPLKSENSIQSNSFFFQG